MKLKKLAKKLDKLYFKKNKQILYVTTHCYFNKKRDFHADIYATDETGNPWTDNSIFLFEIQTLDCFYDLEIRADYKYFRKRKKSDFYNPSLLIESAHTPFYMDRYFTLKKFGCITKEDIENCVKYFTRKVLDNLWCRIWNIKVKIDYEKKKTKGRK